ncbi:FAD/NAD(P)-binding domain-containing protein [Rhizodiscina lignyota]|uniref:FAD/NAD(P)-binding domain-containing protein n=1 Tax=Rhizodiscina lignyota TaxID=1504668 RepID=A0A9P4M641_9PEZI|nr:FAD/NAD(P)-binding domain-containing protein [Rhizodiscina lignyota]
MTDHQDVGDNATVLIIGSGSTGLALAQGLLKAGVKCIVFEKDASQTAKSRDWNMGLHWGAAPLEAVLSAEGWSKLQTVQVDPNVPAKPNDTLHFLNSQTGEVMGGATVDLFYRLRRSKLRALLAEGLDVRYGKRFKDADFSDYEQTVTAYFEDGSSAVGRMLVGADGSRSSVRRALIPDNFENQRLSYAATFVQASFTREQAQFLRQFHPLYLAGIHPVGQFSFFGIQDASDETRPETWIFFFYISWPSSLEEQDATEDWSDAQRLQQLKDFAKDYADPWKSALEWVPQDHPVWYLRLSDWDPGAEGHQWDNQRGRATLVGDAAHTMTYQRGQGLNHSITDAAKLTDALKLFMVNTSNDVSAGAESGDVHLQEESINAFEVEMIARGGAEVRMSTTNTKMLHDWESALRSPVMTKGMHREKK